MKDIILTFIGPDSTGIVARMAAMVEEHGGNWLDSRMIRLGGTFSGIVKAAIPTRALTGFGDRLEQFMEESGFRYSLQQAGTEEEPVPGLEAKVEISGQDHPGIVHAIFTAFQKRDVNVEELSSGLVIAPWSGTPVFEAQARLRIPEGVSLEELQSDLEGLASDLMVEIGFRKD